MMVEEDPKHFFSQIIEFFMPDPVWSRMVNRSYEGWCLGFFGRELVTKIAKESSGTRRKSAGDGSGEVTLKEVDDDDTGIVLARAFALVVEEHLEQHGKERALNSGNLGHSG